MLGVGDIKKVIQCLIGEQNVFNDNDLKRLVQKIFEEVDFDDDGALSFSEFEHVTDMCPDFVKSVYISIVLSLLVQIVRVLVCFSRSLVFKVDYIQ